MKTTHGVLVLIGLIILGVLIFFLFQKEPVLEIPEPVENPTPTESSIIGCYTSITGQDVYTLSINSQMEENVSGTLEFDNFQKDSSSGTFVGTYNDGILLGEYSFTSEGMDSVMQVIFKKVGDDFVRGFGPVDGETGTRFSDLDDITYDETSTLSLFRKSECVE